MTIEDQNGGVRSTRVARRIPVHIGTDGRERIELRLGAKDVERLRDALREG